VGIGGVRHAGQVDFWPNPSDALAGIQGHAMISMLRCRSEERRGVPQEIDATTSRHDKGYGGRKKPSPWAMLEGIGHAARIIARSDTPRRGGCADRNVDLRQSRYNSATIARNYAIFRLRSFVAVGCRGSHRQPAKRMALKTRHAYNTPDLTA